MFPSCSNDSDWDSLISMASNLPNDFNVTDEEADAATELLLNMSFKEIEDKFVEIDDLNENSFVDTNDSGFEDLPRLNSPNYLQKMLPSCSDDSDWNSSMVVDLPIYHNVTDEEAFAAAEFLLNLSFNEIEDKLDTEVVESGDLNEDSFVDMNDSGFEDLPRSESPEYVPFIINTNFIDFNSWFELNGIISTTTLSENDVVFSTVFPSERSLIETEDKRLASALFYGITADLYDTGFEYDLRSTNSLPSTSIYSNTGYFNECSDLSSTSFDESSADLNDSGFDYSSFDSSSLYNTSCNAEDSFMDIPEETKNEVKYEEQAENIEKKRVYKKRKNEKRGSIDEETGGRKKAKYARHKKSSLSYAEIISLAMLNSNDGIVTLEQIYDFMRSNFDSFAESATWRTAIKTVLRKNNQFNMVLAYDTNNNKMVNAYTVADSSIFNELEKTVKKVIETKGLEVLGLNSEAPIKVILDKNRFDEENGNFEDEAFEPIEQDSSMEPNGIISTELFLPLRDHSFDMEHNVDVY